MKPFFQVHVNQVKQVNLHKRDFSSGNVTSRVSNSVCGLCMLLKVMLQLTREQTCLCVWSATAEIKKIQINAHCAKSMVER
jgi:hypothetical protein